MNRPTRARTWIVTAAAALGASVGVAGLAGAATSGSSSSSTATPAAAAATPAPSTAAPDPATVSHGPGETLVTGDTLSTLTAAAKAAQPGASIIRVETDSGGAAYEAHMTKADGSEVTIKFDKNLKVTATQDGFGSRGPGAPGGTAGA